MAIGFDFIGIIVRINAVGDKFPGGVKACLNHWRQRGIHLWHDDFLLFGGGTMSGRGVPDLIRVWQELGLDTHREQGGKVTQWRDVCVCEVMDRFPLPNCSWLLGDPLHGGVYFAGTEPGPCVQRPPHLLEEEEIALARPAAEEEIDRPWRVARAIEEARLDALGLSAEERKRQIGEWVEKLCSDKCTIYR